MNIGFFSETYTPDINGVVTSIKTFRQELEAAGHKVYIFAPAPELFGWPKVSRETRVFRFSSFEYPFYRGTRLAIPFHWPVQRRLKALKLDVVHSHTPFSMGLFAEMVARQQNIPHVHTYHTLFPEYAKLYFPGFKRWNERGMRKISSMFCNAADHIIAPSDGIAERLLEYGVTRPVTTLSTGIARDAFGVKDSKNLIRRRYGIPIDAPLVLTVARLGKEKSIDYLLRSFTQILRFHPEAYYLIVGDGPDRLALETLAKELGVRSRVIFTGAIRRRPDVLRAYATGDVFLFASQTDTQCLTMLEAAAAGLPIVARYDKPLETALQHTVNGFFVKDGEGDEEKFAWKVHRLLTDRKLATQFGRASQIVAKAHSATNRTVELVALYEEVLVAKAAAPASRWRRLAGRTPIR